MLTLGFVWTYFFLPETKGVPLEDSASHLLCLRSRSGTDRNKNHQWIAFSAASRSRSRPSSASTRRKPDRSRTSRRRRAKRPSEIRLKLDQKMCSARSRLLEGVLSIEKFSVVAIMDCIPRLGATAAASDHAAFVVQKLPTGLNLSPACLPITQVVGVLASAEIFGEFVCVIARQGPPALETDCSWSQARPIQREVCAL